MPQELSQEEFFDGISAPRNKELMRVFKDVKLVEQLGSGIQRILKVYDKNIFKICTNFLKVSFPIENVGKNVGKDVGKTILLSKRGITMVKTIVCFANSRKIGRRCFAGKDITTKEWIRPVSLRDEGTIDVSEECMRREECLHCNHNYPCVPIIPAVLDIVKIEFDRHVAESHQIENYLISPCKWKKVGVLEPSSIDSFLEPSLSDLWIDGYDSWNRKNDRFPSAQAYSIEGSLRLIKVDKFMARISTEETLDGNVKRKKDGIFTYNNIKYIIPITDPVIEKWLEELDDGTYLYKQYSSNKMITQVILCLSIGQDFNGYIYKFIAAVI